VEVLDMHRRRSAFLIVLALLPLLSLAACRGPAMGHGDNAEVARLRDEDQADRKPGKGKSIDWRLAGARDTARLARIKEIYLAGELKSGADFQRAALVLQHGTAPEDFLLAHELCIVAIAKGERDALWLCAASEDRFLMNIGRPQRFGTQYRSTESGGPMLLYPIGDGTSDALRAEFHCPSRAEALKREELINSLYKPKP
jgi:hypothetical protein